ncbi:MAG: OmcA/MtrC family decaheme c-type cytochrome, partial [Acidobacteria bacterium]|nr:OmcA/MtrC family decaheme c-type cytochrome [Acidobacteriota bacterium]
MCKLSGTGRLIPGMFLLVGSALLVGGGAKRVFTEHDKAYYADAKLADFVRPGLVLKIRSAEIDTAGIIRARLKLTDPAGLPLDREGVTTPGPISISLIAAHIPKGQTQYVNYATRPVTSPITGQSWAQPIVDDGGTFEKVGDGEYQYIFRTRAPSGFDKTATHSIGAYASRNLSSFDMGTHHSNDVFTFVPDGSKVTQVRDIVRTETCNKRCHDPLAVHGGARRKVELCILCHTPQNLDPDTGNSVNLPVLVHKIHMGADLPSVRAGRPYRIIGFRQTVFDFSTVEFPAHVVNCEVCHDPKSGAAQADGWLKANRAACGACHDNVNFATGEGHDGIVQASDSECGSCHEPDDGREFSLSVRGSHVEPRFSRDLPGTVFQILAVDEGLAGQRPTVTFSIKDKQGNPILPSAMDRVALVLAGGTADYAAAIAVEDARSAEGIPSEGVYFWTFQAAVPAEAKGSYSVGIEGSRSVKVQEGTAQEMTIRDPGINQAFYFSVDGSKVQPRRKVVSIDKCNACHLKLEMHGQNRNQVEHCVQCHNPNRTDEAQRPRPQFPAQTINFRTMIHRIHTGDDLKIEYTIFGFGGRPFDFTRVRFPGDRRNCEKCHVEGSYQLPLPAGLLPTVNPRGYLDPMGPAASACLGCHTTLATASHVLSMTTTLGEA